MYKGKLAAELPTIGAARASFYGGVTILTGTAHVAYGGICV
jgi:hypothetical protein